ncbi:hypothetical protein [Streptomyces aureus]
MENGLAVRVFERNAEVATAAENLLVDALDPAASVYDEPDGEEPASAEDVQGHWRTLLDLAYLDRAHPDLPSEVRAMLGRWTPMGLDSHRRSLRHDQNDQ